jgi:hypothetical protein
VPSSRPSNPAPTVTGTVWGSGPQEVYAIRNGNSPKVWRYDGTTWSPLQDPPTSKRLDGLWGEIGQRDLRAGLLCCQGTLSAQAGWVLDRRVPDGWRTPLIAASHREASV